jgi:hypothetical protein
MVYGDLGHEWGTGVDAEVGVVVGVEVGAEVVLEAALEVVLIAFAVVAVLAVAAGGVVAVAVERAAGRLQQELRLRPCRMGQEYQYQQEAVESGAREMTVDIGVVLCTSAIKVPLLTKLR